MISRPPAPGAEDLTPETVTLAAAVGAAGATVPGPAGGTDGVAGAPCVNAVPAMKPSCTARRQKASAFLNG